MTIDSLYPVNSPIFQSLPQLQRGTLLSACVSLVRCLLFISTELSYVIIYFIYRHPHLMHTSTCNNYNIVVRYVIYCRDYSLNEMILGLYLVWLLLTVKYTFIHTVVVLLLFSLVLSFICIIIKIAIDLFYNREIKLLFRYLPVFLLYGFSEPVFCVTYAFVCRESLGTRLCIIKN